MTPAKEIVDKFVKNTKREVSIDYIQKIVSEYFQMNVDTLQSKTRKRHIVQARQLAMYFAKKFTKASLASIGNQIGKRDHATVLHACKTVDNLTFTDKQFRKYVEDLNQKLTKEIAKFHVESLDKIGSLYYSEESFDDFYYGKGSTYPDINGSIGILFEQASSRGHIQESDNGILKFPFTIKNQLTTGISTLKAAVNLRLDILNYQKTFYLDAAKEASKFKSESIIFGNPKDKYRTNKLAEILRRHEINIYGLNTDTKHKNKIYKKGYAYIVPKNQKKYRLINAMFETRTSFLESLFYDVSSWTLPLAFNLDYDLSFNNTNHKNSIDEINYYQDSNLEKSNYAYMMQWHEYLSPKALNMLLENNIIVKDLQTYQSSLEEVFLSLIDRDQK